MKQIFLTKKDFLKSVFKVNDKKLERIISELLTLANISLALLSQYFVLHMWNIFEHALRVFKLQLIIITSC